MKKINTILILIFVLLEFYLLFNSKDVINLFTKTLNICMYNLMPTMFFSIFFTSILIELEIEKYIPKFIINFLKNIFNISKKEVIIFILSIISGYPNNAKMLKKSKNLNNIINFTCFINPIFLICTVGLIYLKNIKITLIIYLSHILSNIIIGIILRKNEIIDNVEIKKENKSILNTYFTLLKNTSYSLVNIFSNILMFSILTSLFSNIFYFNDILKSIILGILEFSNGTYLISNLPINIMYKGMLILIIITFGSFSIHMQIISINDKVKYLKFLKYRILCALISILIYLPICKLFY